MTTNRQRLRQRERQTDGQLTIAKPRFALRATRGKSHTKAQRIKKERPFPVHKHGFDLRASFCLAFTQLISDSATGSRLWLKACRIIINESDDIVDGRH